MMHVETLAARVARSALPQQHAAPWGLVGLALATLSASLANSIVNVGLPSLATNFLASFSALQWVVVAYLLTSTAVIVAAGRLGDLLGARRLLLGGLALFTTASVAGALAPTLPLLVAARALQGVAGAILMATTLALASTVVAKERTGTAMGLLGTMSAIGTALGPALGGGLVATFGWRALLFASVPLALAALGLVVRHLPPERERAASPHGRFDAPGATLLAAALVAFALATTLRSSAGVRIGLTAAALALGTAFVLVERRAAHPVLPLTLLRVRSLRSALSTNTVIAMVMMGTLVVGPFHLAHALGLAPGEAGLVMALGPVVSAAIGVPAGRLVDRIGAHRVALVGLLGVALGTAALAALATIPAVPAYAGPLVLTTASYALFSAANNTAVMANATADRRGVLSSLLTLTRNLGLTTGATVLGAVFGAACGAAGVEHAPRDVVAAATRLTFGIAACVVLLVGAWSMVRSRRREHS